DQQNGKRPPPFEKPSLLDAVLRIVDEFEKVVFPQIATRCRQDYEVVKGHGPGAREVPGVRRVRGVHKVPEVAKIHSVCCKRWRWLAMPEGDPIENLCV